jgi:hypothetical protein
MSLQIASAQGLIPKTDGTRCLIAGYDKKEMAGYSGTPLAQKLGIKAGQKVATIGRPAGYGKLLAPLPDAVSFATNVEPGSAFIHLFVSERKRTGERAETTPKTDRGHWNSLGLVAQEVFGRRHGRDGRCYPGSRLAARIRRCKSVRSRRNVVRIEINDPARKSTLVCLTTRLVGRLELRDRIDVHRLFNATHRLWRQVFQGGFLEQMLRGCFC